ncbi:MAG: nitrous oxide reductase accessory protein NosL [Bacteroidetes bacterium]|nr:nitrous oxide reductase accessory protein NosL [Bacteroidota bacterium]
MNKSNLFLILIALILGSCNTKPVPLVAGKDVCMFCKMPIADIKFGAEVITEKGRIYTYDDINCMINWMNEADNKSIQLSRKLVVDYLDSKNLIDAENASYALSEKIRSPMNSRVACFKNSEDLKRTFPNETSVLTWSDVIKTIE